MTAPTTPTSGPFRESDPIESATTLILNMVAEQQELSIAAREGFGDPALYRLWLALGQLRGKNGLHLQDGRLPLCDLSNREGQVGEALTDLVVDSCGLDALLETGDDLSDAKGSPVPPSDDSAEHPTLTSETERLIAAGHLLAQHLPTMRSMDRIGLVIELRKILEGRS